MLSSRLVGVCASLLIAGCGSDDENTPDDDTGVLADDAGASGDAREVTSEGRLFDYAVPGELGPFPIGFVTMPFIDESRPEQSTADESDHRTLPSVVWYPAAESARSEQKARYADYFSPSLATLLAAQAPEGFLDTVSDSVKEAPVAEDGPFPLIVFSHGNGGLGVQSFFLTEYLASHGYIVVCPDHTGNALMTELPGGVAVLAGNNGYMFDSAVIDRVADVSFLVDAMTELHAADPQGRFTGAVDLENVGLTGHSFGGLTTLLGMEGDDRFDAGAPMAAATPESSVIDRPVMHFLATEDKTLSNEPIVSNYASLGGPKMLISVIDAGHYSFSNGCPVGLGANDGCGSGVRDSGETFTFLEDSRVHEITNFYQTALWGYYLKEVDEYADDLLAEPFGGDVTIQRDGMPGIQ